MSPLDAARDIRKQLVLARRIIGTETPQSYLNKINAGTLNASDLHDGLWQAVDPWLSAIRDIIATLTPTQRGVLQAIFRAYRADSGLDVAAAWQDIQNKAAALKTACASAYPTITDSGGRTIDAGIVIDPSTGIRSSRVFTSAEMAPLVQPINDFIASITTLIGE